MEHTIKPSAPVIYGAEARARQIDDPDSVIHKIEVVMNRISNSDEPSDADIELYEKYRTAVQYEMRKGRFMLFSRLNDIINIMLDRLENDLSMGDDINITPSQMRLYMSMYLDQTRSEFEEKGPDVLVDQRQQVVNIQVIEVEKTYDGKFAKEAINGR
jgi:hypothetical protein